MEVFIISLYTTKLFHRRFSLSSANHMAVYYFIIYTFHTILLLTLLKVLNLLSLLTEVCTISGIPNYF